VAHDQPEPGVPVEHAGGDQAQHVQAGFGVPAPGAGGQATRDAGRQPAVQRVAQGGRGRRGMQVQRHVEPLEPVEQRGEPGVVEEGAV
jgi:hypothetical protein